jgi:adenylate cyclase
VRLPSVFSRPTLGHVFYLSLAGLTLLLGLLLVVLVESGRRSVLESFRSLGRTRGELAGGQVEAYLYQAEKVIADIENEIRFGACRPEDPLSLEATLFTEVLNNPQVAEVTLTHGRRLGHGEDGGILLAPEDRWQLSVFRESAETSSPILSRAARKAGGRFVSELRRRAAGTGLLAGAFRLDRGTTLTDPTEHLTFRTPASRDYYGETLWSDLSHSQLDDHLPEERRRVVVTVLKAIEDGGGRFVGVVRVGLLTRQIDRIAERESGAQGRVFFCDPRGRLVSRIDPSDRVQERDGDLRFVPSRLPPEIALALAHPVLERISADNLVDAGELTASGREFLVTYRGLARTQGWRVGILVDESTIPGLAALEGTRNRLLAASVVVIAAILLGGAVTMRAVRRGLGQIVDETARMRRFEFTPSPVATPFRDVGEAMESLERAKTAMRAMGKYVPVDLVRQLYESGREPALGGQLLEVSMMFTDIKGFTAFAEQIPPDGLARALGMYLQAMTAAIHETDGTVDKYIGDAVMAIWNAPRPCLDHAARACRAALACVEATKRLFGSAEWAGLPPFVTRFGLHRDRVMVGHFGAPDRMSYTALGDGVNLASRAEGLNKQYGTTILVTEPVREAAREAFAFRRLDRVAVKGKTRGTLVYELLGGADSPPERLSAVGSYEAALDLYFAGEFAAARERFLALPGDPPGRVMAERCRLLLAQPPPAWDGVFVASTK